MFALPREYGMEDVVRSVACIRPVERQSAGKPLLQSLRVETIASLRLAGGVVSRQTIHSRLITTTDVGEVGEQRGQDSSMKQQRPGPVWLRGVEVVFCNNRCVRPGWRRGAGSLN